jgi:hypothetical protein
LPAKKENKMNEVELRLKLEEYEDGRILKDEFISYVLHATSPKDEAKPEALIHEGVSA